MRMAKVQRRFGNRIGNTSKLGILQFFYKWIPQLSTLSTILIFYGMIEKFKY